MANINLSIVILFILTLSTNIVGPVNLKIMSQLNIKRDIILFVALAIFHIMIVSTRMVTWFRILKRVCLTQLPVEPPHYLCYLFCSPRLKGFL